MRTNYPVLLSILFMLLGGCFPAGPEDTVDMDIVLTTYDDGYDFYQQKSYAMPDKIVVGIDIDRNGDTTVLYMKQDFADQILAKIDKNMLTYGWTKVDISEDPDMLLFPAGTSTTTYYYDWWYNWWYDGWYDWYGWYYPPYFTVSSYKTGTLILVLTDPDEGQFSPINKSPAVWISVSNGILTYNFDVDRVTDAVDQSFLQSPYLKVN